MFYLIYNYVIIFKLLFKINKIKFNVSIVKIFLRDEIQQNVMNIGVEMDRQVDWFIGSLIGLLGVYVGLIQLFIELDYISIR